MSRTWATSGAGARPWRSRRKWAACEPSVLGRHRLLPRAEPLPGGDDPGDQRGEPERLAQVRFVVAGAAVGIDRGRERDGGAQDVERMRVPRERAEEGEDRRRDRARGAQPGREGLALGRGRELPEPEEVGRLLEACVGREIADLVPPVIQAARRAVDRGDRRARRDHVLEPRLPGGLHGCLLSVAAGPVAGIDYY